MANINTQRTEALELKTDKILEDTQINYHKNILEQVKHLELEAYEIVEHILKASQIRAKLLNPFDIDLDISDTKNLHISEKTFVDKYRANTMTGEQFKLNICDADEVFDFIEKKLSTVKAHI